jgi:ribosome-interacting GTPase 1
MADDYDIDDLVDVIEGNRIYVPAIYVVNKIDQITLEELEVMDKLPHYCPVSTACRKGACSARGGAWRSLVEAGLLQAQQLCA